MDTVLEIDADEAEIEKLLEEGEVEEKESGELDDDLLDDDLNDDLLDSPGKNKNTENSAENRHDNKSVQHTDILKKSINQETFQAKLQKSFQETIQNNVQNASFPVKTQKSVQNGVYSRPTEEKITHKPKTQKISSETAHFTTSDMRKVLESVDQLRNINKKYAEEVEHLKEIANTKVTENTKLKKERKKYRSKCQDLQTQLENEQNKSCISCAMSSTMLNNLNKENADLADKVEELDMKLMAYQSLRPKKQDLPKVDEPRADLRESLRKRSFDGISDTFSDKSSNSVINGGKFSAGNFKMVKLKRTVIVKQKDDDDLQSDLRSDLQSDFKSEQPLPDKINTDLETSEHLPQKRNFSVEDPLGMSDDDDCDETSFYRTNESSNVSTGQMTTSIANQVLKRKQKGTIKFVNYQTHFGFITTGKQVDIYFSTESLKSEEFQKEDCVFFDIRMSSSGKHRFEACNIRLDEVGTAEVLEGDDLQVPVGLMGRLG